MSKILDLSEEKNWLSLKKDLKQSVGDSAYNNWIKHLNFVSYENNTLSFENSTIIGEIEKIQITIKLLKAVLNKTFIWESFEWVFDFFLIKIKPFL